MTLTVFPLFGYATDQCAETWSACPGATTRDEAAKYAFTQEPEAVEIWTCRAKAVRVEDAFVFRGDSVLEDAEERLSEFAPWLDDAVFRSSLEAREALEERLHAAARGWLKDYPPRAIWEADDMERHIKREIIPKES